MTPRQIQRVNYSLRLGLKLASSFSQMVFIEVIIPIIRPFTCCSVIINLVVLVYLLCSFEGLTLLSYFTCIVCHTPERNWHLNISAREATVGDQMCAFNTSCFDTLSSWSYLSNNTTTVFFGIGSFIQNRQCCKLVQRVI